MTQDPKMSAQAIITLIKGLGEVDRQAVFAAFAIDAPMTAASAPKKAKEPKAPKEPKAEKKPRANAGKPTLHGSWTKHVMKLHGPGEKADHPKTGSTDYQEFLKVRIASARAGELLYNKDMARVKSGEKKIGDPMDEKEAAVGAHTPFVSFWKAQNPAAFEEFKTAWELEHLKDGSATGSSTDDAVTVVDDDGDNAVSRVGGSGIAPAPAATFTEGPAKAKRGPKKMADMTPEELAAAKAKRAANKAAKDSKSNSAEGSRASSPPKVKDD